MNSMIEFPTKFVAGVVAHINEDHRSELVDLACGLAGRTGISDARLLHVDKHGLDLVVYSASGEEPLRIPFAAPLEQSTQFRPAVIALIEQARQRLAAASTDVTPEH